MSLKKTVILCGLGVGLVGVGAYGGAALSADRLAPAEDKFPHMKDAVHSLAEARKHLEMASHDYEGHRLKAIEATNLAIHEIELGTGEKMDNEKKK